MINYEISLAICAFSFACVIGAYKAYENAQEGKMKKFLAAMAFAFAGVIGLCLILR